MFKFTIREAILMTTIVAVLLMWWMERSHNAKYESRLTAVETKLQGFGSAFVPVVPAMIPATVGTTVPPPPTAPPSVSSRRVISTASQPIVPAAPAA